jgi:hypothetical protein
METPCSPFESAPRSSSPSSCHVASPVLMEPALAPSVVTTATLAAYTSQPASQRPLLIHAALLRTPPRPHARMCVMSAHGQRMSAGSLLNAALDPRAANPTPPGRRNRRRCLGWSRS